MLFSTFMKKWTLKKRIISRFAAVLLLLVALASVTLVLMRQIQQRTDRIATSVLPSLVAGVSADDRLCVGS